MSDPISHAAIVEVAIKSIVEVCPDHGLRPADLWACLDGMRLRPPGMLVHSVLNGMGGRWRRSRKFKRAPMWEGLRLIPGAYEAIVRRTQSVGR